MTNKREIESILKLLDDPDEEVYNIVKERLFNSGISIVKKLEQAWELSNDVLMQKRIEQLSHDIQFKYIKTEFNSWLKIDESDLLQPLLLISKFHLPEVDVDYYLNRFQSIVQEIEAELTSGLTPLEQIKVIDHILFQEYKLVRTFTGNKNPENYLLSNIVAKGKGNLMALALFYIIAGQKLQLPLYGLNLPDNFAIAYVDPNCKKDHFDMKDVLFYINPGNKGAIFSKNEINDFLDRIGRRKTDGYFTPISNNDVLTLYMESMLKSYKEMGNAEKSREFAIILKALKRA